MTDRYSLPRAFARQSLAVLLGLACVAAQAQLKSPTPLSLPLGVAVTDAPSASRTADFIVALVNSEPITNHEVRQRLRVIEQQFARRGASLPPRDQLLPQVLEQLINERAQIQHAIDTGVRADEASLLDAERNIAAQNQLSLEQLRERLAADGIDRNRLRADLRNQILLQRVRDREAESRVKITEADIDDYISEQTAGASANLVLDLSHVLVQVPENASEAQVQALQARAQQVADRARGGADFAQLAAEFSDAPERANGGRFGARTADRLPDLFVQATRALPVGGVAGPLRSPAGFHILRVNDKGQAGLPPAMAVQTRARHILLRTGPQLSEEQAVARLAQYRADILAGRSSFEALARQHSQDGSASAGGDLGWAAQGQFVPEFEQVMNRLRPGEVSPPLVSRFGVHLIRVDQRREVEISQREQREQIRALLRERKAQEALELWGEDIRGRAYVEYRDPPQL